MIGRSEREQTTLRHPQALGLMLLSAVTTFWALTALAAVVSGSDERAISDRQIREDLARIMLVSFEAGDDSQTDARNALASGSAGGVILEPVYLGPADARTLLLGLKTAARSRDRDEPLIGVRDRSGVVDAPPPEVQRRAAARNAFYGYVGTWYGAGLRRLGIHLDLWPGEGSQRARCAVARGLARGGILPTLAIVPNIDGRATTRAGDCARDIAPRESVVLLSGKRAPKDLGGDRPTLDDARLGDPRVILDISGGENPGAEAAQDASRAALKAGASFLIADAGEASALLMKGLTAAAHNDPALSEQIVKAASAARRIISMLPSAAQFPPRLPPPVIESGGDSRAPRVRLPRFSPEARGGRPPAGPPIVKQAPTSGK